MSRVSKKSSLVIQVTVKLTLTFHHCRFNQHSMNVLKASLASDSAAAAAVAAKPHQNGQSNGETSSAHPAGPDPAAKKVGGALPVTACCHLWLLFCGYVR